MFSKLKETFTTFSEDTEESLTEKVKDGVTKQEITEDMLDESLDELRMALLKNNVALDVADQIIDQVRSDLTGMSVKRFTADDVIQDSIRDALHNILDVDTPRLDDIITETDGPCLILFMGFNGSGKTTTLSKVAHRLKDDYDVVLAAGDTFRAASIEQLQEHADNLDLPLITHEYGSDAAAVIYDAVQHAENEGFDVVLADTAGRSHADTNLMEALEKICRVNEPDYKILVVDALIGNDVLNQAEEYENIGFDAVALTKTDVDEKGGAALSLTQVTGKPILFIGTGQGYEDLEPFTSDTFIDRVL